MKSTKLFAALLTLGLFSGTSMAKDIPLSGMCGKQAEPAIFFLDYSGSMMEEVKNEDPATKEEMKLKKITEAKKLISLVAQNLPSYSDVSIGVGALAPYTVTLLPEKVSQESLQKALEKLPEDLEVFGRQTNFGEGLLEIAEVSAANEKNREVVKSFGNSPTLILLSDDLVSNRGVQFEEGFAKFKEKYPASKIVLVSFAEGKEKKEQMQKLLSQTKIKEYDGWKLLTDKAYLGSFIEQNLYKDCSFTLGADALFGFDSDKLSPKGKETLRAVSDKINSFQKELKKSGNSLSISAHTDRIGSEQYNQRLSERRLNSVLNELRRNHVDMSVFSEKLALGESQPVTGNECLSLPRKEQIKCYQPDRRVEIKIK